MSNCTLKTITINTDTHKVVPLEPTQEMEDAGRYSRDCPVSGSDKPEDIYKAMLAAAPEYTQSWLSMKNVPKDGERILVQSLEIVGFMLSEPEGL